MRPLGLSSWAQKSGDEGVGVCSQLRRVGCWHRAVQDSGVTGKVCGVFVPEGALPWATPPAHDSYSNPGPCGQLPSPPIVPHPQPRFRLWFSGAPSMEVPLPRHMHRGTLDLRAADPPPLS